MMLEYQKHHNIHTIVEEIQRFREIEMLEKII